jgi:hypothetical protein
MTAMLAAFAGPAAADQCFLLDDGTIDCGDNNGFDFGSTVFFDVAQDIGNTGTVSLGVNVS